MISSSTTCALVALASLASLASAADVARTPPMGFNTVRTFAARPPSPRARRLTPRSLRVALAPSARRPRRVPPTQWNLYHCSVDAAILNNTAASLVSSGLAKVGYEYVNSDGE